MTWPGGWWTAKGRGEDLLTYCMELLDSDIVPSVHFLLSELYDNTDTAMPAFNGGEDVEHSGGEAGGRMVDCS